MTLSVARSFLVILPSFVYNNDTLIAFRRIGNAERVTRSLLRHTQRCDYLSFRCIDTPGTLVVVRLRKQGSAMTKFYRVSCGRDKSDHVNR